MTIIIHFSFVTFTFSISEDLCRLWITDYSGTTL